MISIVRVQAKLRTRVVARILVARILNPSEMASSKESPAHVGNEKLEASASAKNRKAKEPMVSFRQLFRYITRTEALLNAVAYVFSAANGIVMPVCGYFEVVVHVIWCFNFRVPLSQCYAILFGSMINAFNNPSVNLMTTVDTIALYFFLLALGGGKMFVACGCRSNCMEPYPGITIAGIATFLSVALPTITAENQACRVRNFYVVGAVPCIDSRKLLLLTSVPSPAARSARSFGKTSHSTIRTSPASSRRA